MKKILILTAFYSALLAEYINVNDVIEADEDYMEKLKNAGVQFKEVKEDKKSLIELYNEDKNIVDSLNAKDLKLLCKDLDIKFTNEAEIREYLKTMEVLEDK